MYTCNCLVKFSPQDDKMFLVLHMEMSKPEKIKQSQPTFIIEGLRWF